MSATSATARGRLRAEALMVDACTVRYVSGSTLNGSGVDVPTYTTRFSSACKVQARELQSTESDAGGHESTAVRLSIHLPVSAGQVSVDDQIVVTASQDPQLVGRVFRVLAPVGKTFATARRVEVEGVVA
jgi:hypothetical protein